MKTVKWFTVDPTSHQTHSLLKHHPKYCHKLHFTSSNIQTRKVFTKIRAIKVIKSLDVPCYEPEMRPLLLSALKSQRNCLKKLSMKDPALVKYYPRIETYLLCSKGLHSWRVFLQLIHLKILTLECPYIKDPKGSHIGKELGRVKGFYWRFWQHFERLKVLGDFHVSLYNKIDSDLLGFLKKLNVMEEKLNSLRSFSLFLSHIDVASDVDLNFENIYQHLTSFRIHESSFMVIQKFLRNVRHFQKLESLNILKNLSYPEDDKDPADFGFIKHFSQLNRIKTMDILINFGSSTNLLNFLEHFSIPEPIVSLKLSFYEADWSALLSSDQLENLKTHNVFENHPLCLNFYNKWQNLKNLESLSFCFCESNSNDTPSLYFITPILKRLTALESFYFANWLNNFSHTPTTLNSEKIKALNLYYLWKALAHLKTTLKKLYIDSSAISLRKFPSKFELEDQEKLCLKELGLCGLVLGDLCLEALSKTLVKNEEDSSPSRIEMESILIDNKESMMKVMDIIANISKKMRVSVSLDVRNIGQSDFMEMVMKDFVRLTSKSHITIDFHKIPELSDSELKDFKRILHEYRHARLHISGPERKDLRIYPTTGELFGDFAGMMNGGSDGFSLGDEEDEWEGSDEDFEEEISEMTEDMDYLLDDGFEEIDEDI